MSNTHHTQMKKHLTSIIRLQHEATQLAKDLLVELAEMAYILSRSEVVPCIMEALNVERPTAEAMYSRLKVVINDPVVRDQVRKGELRLALQRTTKNVNKAKA